MLRVSAQTTGNANLNLLAITSESSEPSGVAGGEALTAFAEAAVKNTSDLARAREQLKSELGEAALVDGAAVVGNFERMTRIADGTGIPIDERNIEFTREARETLHLVSCHTSKVASARLPA